MGLYTEQRKIRHDEEKSTTQRNTGWLNFGRTTSFCNFAMNEASWPENQGILFFIYFSNISNEPDIFHGCTS